MGANRWRFSLRNLFIAVTCFAGGLGVSEAVIARLADFHHSSDPPVVVFGMPLATALFGAGIGALVGTPRAVLLGFSFGFVSFLGFVFLAGLLLVLAGF